MNQEYEELKEPDSGGGLVNMISKGIGLFFGRQSETKGSQSEINEDWPPKPERGKGEATFNRADSEMT